MWLTDPPETLWPSMSAQRLAEASRLIPRAEAIILQRFSDIQQRIAEGKISLTVVAGVVEDMVGRALAKSDRDGLEKLQYPEVMMEWESDGGLGQGSKLWLTTDEVVLLAPSRSSKAFSIRKPPRVILAERNW